MRKAATLIGVLAVLAGCGGEGSPGLSPAAQAEVAEVRTFDSCKLLQGRFDAMMHLAEERYEPGTQENVEAVAIAKAAHERMQAVGCYR